MKLAIVNFLLLFCGVCATNPGLQIRFSQAALDYSKYLKKKFLLLNQLINVAGSII